MNGNNQFLESDKQSFAAGIFEEQKASMLLQEGAKQARQATPSEDRVEEEKDDY